MPQRTPLFPCRRVGHPSFFQGGCIQRGRISVYESEVRRAPRGPVAGDVGTGRRGRLCVVCRPAEHPAASASRPAWTGRPHEGRVTARARPPGRVPTFRSGPIAARLSPREGRGDSNPHSEHQGHDIQTYRARGFVGSAIAGLALLSIRLARGSEFRRSLQGRLPPSSWPASRPERFSSCVLRRHSAAWGPSLTTPPVLSATPRAPSAAATTAWRPGTAR